MRTFLIAMNLTEDDPHRIEEAVACLDLSGMPPDRRDGGRLAFELEFILRSTNIPTGVIPDVVDGPDCAIGENKDIKLTLHRMPDGRWLFDGKTLQDLPKMRLFLWQRALAAGQGKTPATSRPTSDRLTPSFRTFIDAFKKGDLDTAAKCLDLTEIPDPARQIVGRELAFKLKEVLDRTVFVIFQDFPIPRSASRSRRWSTRRDGSPRSGRSRAVARDNGSSTGPRSGPWTGSTTLRVEAHPPRAGRDAAGRPAARVPARAGTVAPSPAARLAQVSGRSSTDHSRSPCISSSGLVLLVLLVVPVYRLVVVAARPACPGADALAGGRGRRSRGPPCGSARSAGWPSSGCSSRA